MAMSSSLYAIDITVRMHLLKFVGLSSKLVTQHEGPDSP